MKRTVMALMVLILVAAGAAEAQSYNYYFRIHGTVLAGRPGFPNYPCTNPVVDAQVTFGVFPVTMWGTWDYPLVVFTGPATDENGYWEKYCSFTYSQPGLVYDICRWNPVNQRKGQCAWRNYDSQWWVLDICVRGPDDVFPHDPVEGEKSFSEPTENATWSSIKSLYR